MKVRDIMTTNVVSVREDAPLEEVCRLMLEHRIGSIPVVDALGKLRGMITESSFLHDLLRILASGAATQPA